VARSKSESQAKLAFAKTQYAKGVKAPAKLQQLVKAKFGSGMNFRDLGKVFPRSKKKAKKKAGRAARRGPGRPPSRAGARRGPGRPPKRAGSPGRPVGDEMMLVVGDVAEPFGSKRKLESRVAELVSQGVPTENIAVYEKARVRMTIKTQITV
jgi:hypothetical protein